MQSPTSSGTTPVAWHVFDNFIDAITIDAIAEETNKPLSYERCGKWFTYSNKDEKKTTCNDPESMGPVTSLLLDKMQGDKFVSDMEELFSISPLQSDPLLHGGGIHICGAGGLLSIHLDYAKHKRLPLLERRLNAILYLSQEWKEEWGGATVLTKPDGCTVLNRVHPKPGRLFVFETNDLSYHGVEPVTCPEGVERVTLATYYLSHIRPGVTRERALFIPNRNL